MTVRRTLRLAAALTFLLSSGRAGAAGPTPFAYPRTPRAVVDAYCRADLGGAQTSSETWRSLAQYAAWSDAPGWDTFTIVSGYTLSLAGTSKVRVVYNVLGVLEGEEARAEPRQQIVVYRLVRRGGRWKIAAPQLEPHVAPEVALKLVDGLAHNAYVRPDLEKLRASRDIISKMVDARTGP